MKTRDSVRILSHSLAVLLLLALVPTASWAQGTLFVEGGNVGIGTDTPGTTFHVFGLAGDTKVLVVDSNGTAAVRELMELRNNGGINFTLNNTATGVRWKMGHKFTNDEYVITRLGSGVTEFELAQNGDLRISGSLTTAGGFYPDYVFEPGYELMPLDELASYIEANRHLPNVPSADEVEGGAKVNMTELQLRLLEKVEELTLYTLQQEETIQAQQEHVAALEERLARLEAETETE